MRWIRVALLAAGGAAATSAAAEVPVTSHARHVEQSKPQSCQTIDRQALDRVGGQNIADVVGKLPQPSCPSPTKPAVQPPVNYTVPNTYESGNAHTDTATTDASDSTEPFFQPRIEFEPMGNPSGASGLQFPAAKPELVPGPEGPMIKLDPRLTRFWDDRTKTPFGRVRFNSWYDLGWVDEAFYQCDGEWLDELYDRIKEDRADARNLIASGRLSKEDADEAEAMIRALTHALDDISYYWQPCPKIELKYVHKGYLSEPAAKKLEAPAQPKVSATTAQTALAGPAPNAEQQRILEITNQLRAVFGVNPVHWSGALAGGAAAAAQHLAQIKQLEHAPREGRGDVRENLLRIRAGSSPDDMMEVWISEAGDLTSGDFPNVARDGHWERVAHLTQIIWPETTDMGCATAQSDGFIYLVCRYYPGGNKDGKPVGLMSASNDMGTYKRRKAYCSKQEQIDDLFVLQKEMIAVHESTALGRIYSNAIQAEIERVKQAKIDPCARSETAGASSPSSSTPAYSTSGDLKLQPKLSVGLKGNHYSAPAKSPSGQAPKVAVTTTPTSASPVTTAGVGSLSNVFALSGFDGPLMFTTTMLSPKYLNPSNLHFGTEAVDTWALFNRQLDRCDIERLNASIAKLEYYAQAAREHSAEEKTKGNSDLSEKYAAMARQIDTRVDWAKDQVARCPLPVRG